MAKNLAYLHQKKRDRVKIAMLTCYDYPTAVLQDQAGLDVIFVGDSLGTNVLGYPREIFVTLEDIQHHLRAVRRGVEQAYLLVDMPYQTYETPESALRTARALLDYGADGVKLEGMHPEVVTNLAEHGIEVWAHLGYNPQFHDQVAVQGKTFDRARQIVEDAEQLEAVGAQMLVLELVPEELGQVITDALRIPTIGIGAGRYTDGQVLIVHDMLGITPRTIHHARDYGHLRAMMTQAFEEFIASVEGNTFPEVANVRHLSRQERNRLLQWRRDRDFHK